MNKQVTKIDLTRDELVQLRVIGLQGNTTVPAILARLARKYIGEQLRRQMKENRRG
jgi:hypothetical protein